MKVVRWLFTLFLALVCIAGASYSVALLATGDRARLLDEIGNIFKTVDGVVELPKTEPKGIEPVAGKSFKEPTIRFTFEGRACEITPQVKNEIYYGAVAVPRTIQILPGVNSQDAHEDLYQRLTTDAAMKPALRSVVAQLRLIKDEENLSDSAYAELIAKYVQSIPYDMNRAELARAQQSVQGDPRMPVQVLVDGTGDCDEKVMLAAALYGYEGYETVALSFEPEQHMSLGIKSEGSGYLGSGYEFVETTSPSYISEVPKTFVGGITLQSEPFVYSLSKGERAYSRKAVRDIEYIVAARDSALDAASAKKSYIESTPMDKAEFNRHKAQYEACFTAYNTLQATVREDGTSPKDFKDRRQALRWLDNNCWWLQR